MSFVHALLYAPKQPLAAEEIADTLGIARSNVPNSLRELQTWNLIRPEMCRDDKAVDPVVQLRLREMLDFVERISRWYDQMIALPRSTIATLIKLGGGIARLLDRSGRKSRDL
jgi:predicted transcriptional regulator